LEVWKAERGLQVPEVAFLDQYFEEIAARLERRIDQRGPQTVPPKRLFTVPEAAEYLGRTENAVKLLIHRGKLPVTRIDSKSQIDKKALDKLIDDCTYFESEHRT
jgi:excisionase family DNA binding protein